MEMKTGGAREREGSPSSFGVLNGNLSVDFPSFFSFSNCASVRSPPSWSLRRFAFSFKRERLFVFPILPAKFGRPPPLHTRRFLSLPLRILPLQKKNQPPLSMPSRQTVGSVIWTLRSLASPRGGMLELEIKIRVKARDLSNWPVHPSFGSASPTYGLKLSEVLGSWSGKRVGARLGSGPGNCGPNSFFFLIFEINSLFDLCRYL